MPWTPYKLNDGRLIPSIAYGSAFRNGTSAEDYPQCVRDAYAAGFRHFDTSEAYHNEELVGEGLSSLPRSEVFVTTKWGETPAPTAIRASLKKLQMNHVDLYLIHQPNHLPRLPPSVIPALWEEMETIRSKGLARSIGVGNFDIPQLEALLDASSVVPAVNQIAFNPLEYANPSTRMLLDYHTSHGIRTEGYGANQPITKQWMHIMEVVKQIATKLSADDSDVLQAWARRKGVLVVTTSTSPERMKSYIAGGDLELDAADIRSIDRAGEAERAARIA